MKHLVALLFCFLALAAASRAATLPPGLYERSGHTMFVGVEHELPDAASNDFFDPHTQRTGALRSAAGFVLQCGLHEKRRVVGSAQGPLGVSLYYTDAKPRATIMLIHGNDPETRDMGFIIPYFACNGVNVISYDQRGTGQSTGNWFLSGPIQRAKDAATIYDAFRSDPRVDAKRIGVWGFSNGGWTAPILAVQRPLAFMILKSAPTESLKDNIDFEVIRQMQRHGQSNAAITSAVALWHAVENGVDGSEPWPDVKRTYDAAASQSWFADSLMLKIPIPPSISFQDGFRRAFSYDPAQTLKRVQTPTLALYGALDYKVDVPDSSSRIRKYFAAAGMRDFTMNIYPHAGHPLIVTDATALLQPERYAPGYPQVMLTWLERRGFTVAGRPS